MRVPTRSTSENVISQLQKLGTQQAQLQKQVSTNQRIFLPSDDPAAMGRMLSIGNEQSQILQYKRNIDVGTNLAQASYSGLTGLNNLLTRAGELSTLGGGVLNLESARAYGSEVNQLLEQAVHLGNTRFGNDYLFAGTALDTAPFTVARDGAGQITAATYAGNLERASIPLSETATIAPRTDGATNEGIRDLINRLVALRDALNVNDTTTVHAAGVGLEGSTDTILGAISENGAIQLRLDVAKTQQTSRADSLENLASAEADADLAGTMVKLSQTTTSYQAALASASKIMNLSLLDYLR
ncbi:flagellin [Rariglobus hedericola]|uniref:Flagellin n=1 Tax=Rariglobus hedericola TaxID=2597822 RepID=A0A556QPQ9_9BACT|nr:flagellin [Rariglobus hedericola]TSJ78626.1 flagellin [Rariglobus hedericola]